MTIYALTWNCGVTLPDDLGDRKVLRTRLLEKSGGADLIAVSLQEIVELNPTQIMNVDPEIRFAWEAVFSELLRPDYALLVGNQLVGTTLSVYCRTSALPHIRGVEVASKKTGFGGITGNKGSVAVRLDWHDTSLCIVASHFCAGQGAWRERDEEFHYVKDHLGFSRSRTILRHHTHVIWLGDLNYRIEGDGAHIRSLLSTLSSTTTTNYNALGELSTRDQLRMSIEQESAFAGFREGPLTNFPPTYKYDPGTDTYDTSEKARTPAWTDRILLHTQNESHLSSEIVEYGCLGEVRISDHRPVYALLRLTVEKILVEAKLRLQGEIYGKHSALPLFPARPEHAPIPLSSDTAGPEML